MQVVQRHLRRTGVRGGGIDLAKKTDDKMVSAQKTIGRRVGLSKELLKAMGITPEQFERVALNALVVNPKIAECTQDSIELAIIRCAECGLMPDGHEAVILPFGGKATLVKEIAGKIRLAKQATPGLWIHADCAYQGEVWEYRGGTDPVIRHEPSPTAIRTPDKMIAAYAVAMIPSCDRPEYEVLFTSEVDSRHKARAPHVRAKQNGPWDTDYARMAQKAVLGVLLGRLPTKPGRGDTFEDTALAVVGAVEVEEPEDAPLKPLSGAKPPRPKGIAPPPMPQKKQLEQGKQEPSAVDTPPPPQEAGDDFFA